ncbi:MAG TPA: DMT family transporter [Burkholderiales bacterium]|nr:DMT family transporter [Burkholderiales bacterium]
MTGRTLVLTALAMLAFAGNSLLCRLALKNAAIDPATFTCARLVSGALALWCISRALAGGEAKGGNWASALALFAYAAAFSFAYVSLSAGTGALLLFGAVQATMILTGLVRGERLQARQGAGLVIAIAGLVFLLLPGIAAPPPLGAALMVIAGIAWGIYSLRGRGAGNPLAVTAGNFARTIALAAPLGALCFAGMHWDARGMAFAVASGALTSGVGYAIWYSALRGLKATSAASVQLSVPIITAAGGVSLLGESIGLRLVVASVAVLGGIALVIAGPRRPDGRNGG